MKRVGLGCMRLSTEAEVREPLGHTAVLHAALDAGVRLFDTAHAYGRDETDLGANERLVRAALRAHPQGGEGCVVVTKGGMARVGTSWRPDGRASTLRAHALASAEALGAPLDVLLVHAPDPAVAWGTTLRELARLRRDGVAKEVGVSNVSLAQLDEALEVAEVTWVQAALSVHDDRAVRSGVLQRCEQLGLRFLAHSPLGGPRQVARTLAHSVLGAVAAELGCSPAVVGLAAVAGLSSVITVIPGARRVTTARELAAADSLELPAPSLQRLRDAFPALRPLSERGPVAARAPRPRTVDGEVVLIMGLQGAGKSALVERWVGQGYARLNRDELSGTLDAVARKADALIAGGQSRLVLDNTYATRASRAGILDVAARHGLPVRGLWLDVPLHEAQVNVIWRMLDRHHRLLSPDELKRGKDNTSLPPVAQLRLVKSLEPPTVEEGFAVVEVVPFVRRPRPGQPAVYAAASLAVPGAVPFDWRPDGPPVDGGLTCPHPAGPPLCWCRPPLPGLLLAHAHAHGVDLRASTVHGTSPAHEVMALVVGARYIGQ